VPPPAAPVTPAPAIETVDINTADVATLDRRLDGIGEKKVQAMSMVMVSLKWWLPWPLKPSRVGNRFIVAHHFEAEVGK